MPTRSLEGKTVFITGATRGIGAAIAEIFSTEGAKVVGTGTTPKVPATLDGYFQTDFKYLAQIEECVHFVEKLSPDILINNAGINRNFPFLDIPIELFQEIQQVNVLAPFSLCQAAIPGMIDRGWGRIVNISSIWGKISKEHRASYSASKFALDGLTLSIAAEFARDGILANCVAPGFTDTDLTRSMLGEKGISEILKNVPIAKMAQVGEIAKFVLWLAGNENTYVTGQNIPIDGGFSRV